MSKRKQNEDGEEPFHKRINLTAENDLRELVSKAEPRPPTILNLDGFTHQDAEVAKVEDYRLVDLIKTLVYDSTQSVDKVHRMFDTQYPEFYYVLRYNIMKQDGILAFESGHGLCTGWNIRKTVDSELQIEVFTDCLCKLEPLGLIKNLSPPTFVARFKKEAQQMLLPLSCSMQPDIKAIVTEPALMKAIAQIMTKTLLHEIVLLRDGTERDGSRLAKLRDLPWGRTFGPESPAL